MTFKQLFEIAEGWRNHLIPPADMKEKIKQVSDYRLAICRACPHNSENVPDQGGIRPDEHCTMCGCTLVAKTKCFSCFCPASKWLAIATDEEWQQIKQTLGDGNF